MIEVNNIKLDLIEETEDDKTFIVNDSIIIVTDEYLNVRFADSKSSNYDSFYNIHKEEIHRYIRQYFMFLEIIKGGNYETKRKS